MITYNQDQKAFYLTTNKTMYIIRISEYGHLEKVYYNTRLEEPIHIDDLVMRYEVELGSSTSYSKEAKGYQLNHMLLEVPTFGKGDYREPLLFMELSDQSRTLDFIYESYEIVEGLAFKNMPQASKDKTLVVTLKLAGYDVFCKVYYSVFEESDVIVKNVEIINNGEDIVLDKVLSANLDMFNKDYSLLKLDGAWIRERHLSSHQLSKGVFKLDSKKGVSGSDHNPFVILKEKKTMEDYGNCYGMALIYSGNFECNIEVSSHDLLRVNMGVSGFDFRYYLGINERFIAPEVVFSFSATGLNTLTNNFHNFINGSIINENFRYHERPIVVNNWEATYFDFNQKKLMAIAKKAKTLGIELFCLDDGWFSSRNDDYSSLGDWYYNKEKLPRGVSGICSKINHLGLDFGIWVEPEMVNEDSDLFREHPDWAVSVPNLEKSLGRNQLLLDLTNQEVRTYLKNVLSDLFGSANIKYVKWDMNRNFSDVYSHTLDQMYQGSFGYLYTMGLYEILEYLVNQFPHILFESCASGGNRFDLGMAYYMPQTWTSDNTDSYERILIQEGTSMLYPLSMISNHVSGDRSHQVLRHTPLESRFNVASFGVLGYELDLSKLTSFDSKVIQKQVEFYKEYRHLFQYGTLKRVASFDDGNETVWMVIGENKEEALVLYYQDRAKPNPGFRTIELKGLEPGKYKVINRTQYMNVRVAGSLINHILPIKLKVNGLLYNTIANHYLWENESFEKELISDSLGNSELLLYHGFTGTGQTDKVMIMPDYGSRLFYITKENKNED
jgi:alpha-galactosidase